MWPFNLPGPDFLVFYLFLAAIVVTAVALLRHAGEPSDMPKVNLSDPYLIAFLRGGKNETLRVVTMALVDRNLLTASGTKLASTEAAWGKARSEVEQKVVKHFTPSAEASTLFKMKEADDQMRRYEEELTRLGLLPDYGVKEAQLLRMWVALLGVLGIAVAKIIVAVSTGHFNIEFLCLMGVVLTVVIVKIARPRRTLAGDRMIADLRALCGGLKTRAQELQGGANPAEFALMAAVFGMAMVPDAKKLFPQGGGGSSCGSSCGSGGGSSCGGGGCGGCGGG